MRLQHTIEACNNAEDPIWYAAIQGDEPEEFDGTAAQYGRDVLQQWIADESTLADQEPPRITDEYGNPYLRILVHFEDSDQGWLDAVAIIGADELDDPAPEIAAVEAARDAKLYARHLDQLADYQLEEALTTARNAGHGANELARRAAPAVSRPIALRMMSR